MSYIMALSHQKGGVAKSTTVLSVGASLAEKDYRVLLIDLDPAANLTSGLGLNPYRIQKSAADVFLGNDSLEMVIQPSGLPHLDILPSNQHMGTAAQMLSIRHQHEHLLHNSINQSNGAAYDYILVDCPPSLGALPMVAMVAANLVIIPIQCEYFALQTLNGVFKFINKARALYNPNLHYRILITMFDRRGKLHTDILEKMQPQYRNDLFETKIGYDSKLRASQIAGVPITDFAPRTRAAQQYRTLASEIVAYAEKQKTSQSS
jgi:chromosome partitioning protein